MKIFFRAGHVCRQKDKNIFMMHKLLFFFTFIIPTLFLLNQISIDNTYVSDTVKLSVSLAMS